jgi:hypothetical protein
MSPFRVSRLVLVAIAPIVVYLKIAAQTAERRTASEELVAEKSSTCRRSMRKIWPAATSVRSPGDASRDRSGLFCSTALGKAERTTKSAR